MSFSPVTAAALLIVHQPVHSDVKPCSRCVVMGEEERQWPEQDNKLEITCLCVANSRFVFDFETTEICVHMRYNRSNT